ISDFVADSRAPTPTGAAEMAVPSKGELKNRIRVMDRTMYLAIQSILKNANELLGRLRNAYAFRYPKYLVSQKEQELDTHVERLVKIMRTNINQEEKNYKQLNDRLWNQHPLSDINRGKKEHERLTRLMTSFMQKK